MNRLQLIVVAVLAVIAGSTALGQGFGDSIGPPTALPPGVPQPPGVPLPPGVPPLPGVPLPPGRVLLPGTPLPPSAQPTPEVPETSPFPPPETSPIPLSTGFPTLAGQSPDPFAFEPPVASADTVRRQAVAEAEFAEPATQPPCCQVMSGNDDYRLQRQIDTLSNYVNRWPDASGDIR